ncbi:ER membrane protein complex subunit 5-like [Watersipora subatra]|uniref:ER membrane protein complex subunit 5-like n=1 Tax=Watersipora subatra TaxID=2589382 RepID=UPI00355BF73A
MKSGIGGFCACMGIALSLHAAYSAAQHRTYLRITEQEYRLLPLDILIQTFIALFLICYGVIAWKLHSLREIRANADTEHKTWETFGNRSNFYVFSHRGRFVFETNMIQEG